MNYNQRIMDEWITGVHSPYFQDDTDFDPEEHDYYTGKREEYYEGYYNDRKCYPEDYDYDN